MEKNVYEFIAQQTKDPIVEWKTCKVSWEEFPVYQSDVDFYDKISPIINGKKYSVPAPTLCPEEREKRRLTRKNERKLYKRTCDASGKQIISIYSPDKPYKIYDQQIWRSDQRNPMEYGQVYDFSKSFFQQFDWLLKQVPLMNVYIRNSENSEYNNIIDACKNCYLCVSTWDAENTLYTTLSAWLKNCIDGYLLLHSENCYEAIDCDYCYECFFVQRCDHCSSSSYLQNCSDCVNCTMCTNINHKQYCFLNQEHTKEEYQDICSTLKDKSKFDEYYQKYMQLLHEQPLHNGNIKSIDSIWWNIVDSKNCNLCFDTIECSDCKYCAGLWLNAVDCFDCWWGDVFQTQLSYESVSIPLSHTIAYSFNCWETNNVFYCFDCYYSSHLFACVGLRNKHYCILNKQYTKEEYDVLMSKIIEHMQAMGERWEFYPMAISPFGYNETSAQDFFPQTKEEIMSRNGKWQSINYDTVLQNDIETLKGNQIPQDISNVSDTILKSIFICETSGRPFRITKTELDFYRKYNLSLPHKHPDVRHQERIKKRQSRELHLRNCIFCKKEFLSVYDESHQGKIYCEECYVKEIYW